MCCVEVDSLSCKDYLHLAATVGPIPLSEHFLFQMNSGLEGGGGRKMKGERRGVGTRKA